MKRSKKTSKTYSARSNVSRRDRDRMMKKELARLAEEAGVDISRAKFGVHDIGARGYSSIATGVFFESSSGYGFVRTEDYERGDIFVPASERRDAIGGDTVTVSFHEYRDGAGRLRTEGRITEIKQKREPYIVGTVREDIEYIHRRRVRSLTLLPDDAHIRRELTLFGEAEGGDKIRALIKRHKGNRGDITLEVSDIYGKADDPYASYAAILAECGIATEFSPDELAQARECLDMPVLDEGRVRYSGTVFTIDSEWAKDLDDAIAIRRRPKGGYILYVHIADVSYYVPERTPLDRLVTARGTSVYFTDRVVPMLPRELSDEVCSLHPGGDKYTLSAEITLSERGEIEQLKLNKGIINSTVKGVYSEINRIFDGTADADILKKYKAQIPSLRTMHELYLILKKRSEARGAVELESSEVYIPLDEHGMPTDIIKQTRGDAEMMIEQFMLTANEAVACYLTERAIPLVYRIHEAPSAEKLTALADYLQALGIGSFALRKEGVRGEDIRRVLDEAKERGVYQAVSYQTLRSMAKAKYSEARLPHFGLGIDTYCHFTSPIRRLSDLATHRIIHKVLFDGASPSRYVGYARRAAAAATEGELRALSAERKIEALYKVMYMQDKVGLEFDACVTGVSEHGLFVTPENTCEGLIPLSSLGMGYIYDEASISIRRQGIVYTVGTPVRVRLEEADVSLVRLRYSLITDDYDNSSLQNKEVSRKDGER